MRLAMSLLLCLFSACHGESTIAPALELGAAVADGAARDAARLRPDLTPVCGGGDPACLAGALCQTAQGCCSCGPFARACISGWTCAVPAANDPRCPAAPPTPVTACTLPDGIACWYCTAGSPLVAECTSADGRSECQMVGLTRCWGTGGPTHGCD